MLVLSRKKNESIVMDGKIEIEVLRIKGNTVRLGIKAPRSIKVLRGELSAFEIESQKEDQVAEHSTGYQSSGLERLPNPFVVVQAS